MFRSRISQFHKELFLKKSDTNLLFNPVLLPIANYKRKPRWVPVARSKLFRIPVKQKIPIEEEVEFRRLFNHYRTAIKSLREYFAEKTKQLTTGEEVIAEHLRQEEEENKKCVILNEEWNTEVALLREQRIATEKEQELENIIRMIDENKRLMEERKEQVEAIVRVEKEKSKHYITPENIDEAIENAMNTIVDHNYAIDREGNHYQGRGTKPPRGKPERESAQVSEAAA